MPEAINLFLKIVLPSKRVAYCRTLGPAVLAQVSKVAMNPNAAGTDAFALIRECLVDIDGVPAPSALHLSKPAIFDDLFTAQDAVYLNNILGEQHSVSEEAMEGFKASVVEEQEGLKRTLRLTLPSGRVAVCRVAGPSTFVKALKLSSNPNTKNVTEFFALVRACLVSIDGEASPGDAALADPKTFDTWFTARDAAVLNQILLDAHMLSEAQVGNGQVTEILSE